MTLVNYLKNNLQFNRILFSLILMTWNFFRSKGTINVDEEASIRISDIILEPSGKWETSSIHPWSWRYIAGPNFIFYSIKHLTGEPKFHHKLVCRKNLVTCIYLDYFWRVMFKQCSLDALQSALKLHLCLR